MPGPRRIKNDDAARSTEKYSKKVVKSKSPPKKKR